MSLAAGRSTSPRRRLRAEELRDGSFRRPGPGAPGEPRARGVGLRAEGPGSAPAKGRRPGAGSSPGPVGSCSPRPIPPPLSLSRALRSSGESPQVRIQMIKKGPEIQTQKDCLSLHAGRPAFRYQPGLRGPWGPRLSGNGGDQPGWRRLLSWHTSLLNAESVLWAPQTTAHLEEVLSQLMRCFRA